VRCRNGLDARAYFNKNVIIIHFPEEFIDLPDTQKERARKGR